MFFINNFNLIQEIYMYLEISDRQTGKSTRLINQIYFDKDKYDLQILMGMNFNHLKQIKDKIKRNSKVKICLSYDKLKHLIMNNPNKKIRLHVDEFMYSTAFCNNFNELKTQYPLSELINNRLFFFIT